MLVQPSAPKSDNNYYNYMVQGHYVAVPFIHI